MAFLTLPNPNEDPQQGGNSNVNSSKKQYIDCIVKLTDIERAKLKEALYCYESFIDVINETNVIEHIGDKVHFEFFGENFEEPVGDISYGL